MVGGMIVGACLLAAVGRSQMVSPESAEEPTVHRMEIHNGGKSQVRYFARGLTPAERQVLRQMERTESGQTRDGIAPLLWTTLGRAASPRLRRALELAEREESWPAGDAGVRPAVTVRGEEAPPNR
jgi:hypothetical protein